VPIREQGVSDPGAGPGSSPRDDRVDDRIFAAAGRRTGMTVSRRRLLALLPATLAGCGGFPGDRSAGGSPTDLPGTETTTAPTRQAGPEVPAQSVSIGNARSTPAFVTVAVGVSGETVFVGSRELVPGERRTMAGVLDRAGTYDVVVETADGERATYRWAVVPDLDGLAVTLADGIDVVRTVRCGSDCALAGDGTRLDGPLVGDGSGRWYAPAQVVLVNPGAATDAALTVSLDGDSLVDARYRIRRGTRVVVPLTYRSGTYRVAVETATGRAVGDWLVPEQPSRVVDVSTLAVGCGPANTELRVENADDRAHDLRVAVAREGELRFASRYSLDPGATRTVVPVADSGRYEVRLRVDDGTEQTATWWSCPPHGPGTVVVDATGAASFRQAGL
jgi:hypothetical protein